VKKGALRGALFYVRDNVAPIPQPFAKWCRHSPLRERLAALKAVDTREEQPVKMRVIFFVGGALVAMGVSSSVACAAPSAEQYSGEMKFGPGQIDEDGACAPVPQLFNAVPPKGMSAADFQQAKKAITNPCPVGTVISPAEPGRMVYPPGSEPPKKGASCDHALYWCRTPPKSPAPSQSPRSGPAVR
jgi:hypothetical protein